MPSHSWSPGQLLRRGPLVVTALIVGLFVIVFTLTAMRVTGQDDGVFTRDVRAVAIDEGVDLPIYAGVVSVFNNLLWVAAAALALCAAVFARERRRWHLLFGCLLLIFAADDSYMLHEGSGSRGVELGFYAAYAMAGAWLLFDAARRRDGDNGFTFVLGGVFLASAAFTDVATYRNYLIEDGAKLLGALVWLTIPIATLARLNSAALGNAKVESFEPIERSARRPGG